MPTLVTMSKDGTLTVAKKADLVVMNLRAGNVDTADLHIGPLIVRGLARVENPTRIEATIQSNSKPVESTETRRNIASIDCEKCMVEGERCVKILAFHHVLTRDELPAIYLQRAPHFYRVGRREINPLVVNIPERSEPKFQGRHVEPGVGILPVSYYPNRAELYLDAVYVFADLLPVLLWMKRCGARLPKCRTREDERAKAQEPEWSGKMTFKI